MGHHVCYRAGKRGGGISIFIKDSIDSIPIDELTYITDMIELNVVKIKLNARLTVQVLGIYRLPDQSIYKFNTVLWGILATIQRSAHVYLMGDLNIDLLDLDPLVEEYCSILESVSFLPVITGLARVTNHSRTLLGNI